MAPSRIAELRIVRTSAGCLSYRLVAAGRSIFTTRTFDFGPAEQEARRRLDAWADRHGYQVIEVERRRRA